MKSEKIVTALKRVHQKIERQGGGHILHTSAISREDRELLLRTRWLEEIIRGWYLITRPDVPLGDSTPWYASFWEFLRTYLERRYKTHYCLSAESSIDLWLGDLTIPKQVIVIAKKGSGTPLKLPHNISLLVYADPTRLVEERQAVQGLQVMPLALALARVTPTFFIHAREKAEIALNSIDNVSELLQVILRYNLLTAAERFVGAFRFMGKETMANDLKAGLLAVGIKIQEVNPFKHEAPLILVGETRSPCALRLQAMWANFREEVIAHFPKLPRKLEKEAACLKHIQDIYSLDAYHSLSIEGYQVTHELIERVQNGLWSPDQNSIDAASHNALAARGYFEAFQKVKGLITQILKGKKKPLLEQEDISEWYKALFSPSVQAGILSPADLYGWRRHQVYIRGSRHTPLSSNYLREAMGTLFACLHREDHPAVKAILGHLLFVYIHPYMDGNGRIARFLMNTCLVSGGYPWTVIRVENRAQYFATLEEASVNQNIVPFTRFVRSQLELTR